MWDQNCLLYESLNQQSINICQTRLVPHGTASKKLSRGKHKHCDSRHWALFLQNRYKKHRCIIYTVKRYKRLICYFHSVISTSVPNLLFWIFNSILKKSLNVLYVACRKTLCKIFVYLSVTLINKLDPNIEILFKKSEREQVRESYCSVLFFNLLYFCWAFVYNQKIFMEVGQS